MLKKSVALLLCILLIYMGGCTNAFNNNVQTQPEMVLRYADVQSEKYPSVQAAYYFAEQVLQQTNGRIKIEVYPNAELGTEPDSLTQLQIGGIDFARVSVATMSSYDEKYNILQLPYLFVSREHMWRVLKGNIGESLFDEIENVGFVGLAWYDTGARSFYTTVPVNSFTDFKDLNIRTQNNLLMQEFITCLDATPVVIDYLKIYSSLQTGEIDGAENNMSSFALMEHDDYAKYCFLDEHNIAPEVQVMSKKTFDSLQDEDKKIIKECALLAADYEKKVLKETENEALQLLADNGVTFSYPTAAEISKIRSEMQPLYTQFAADYNDIILQIKKME